jgi:hypothetical protein
MVMIASESRKVVSSRRNDMTDEHRRILRAALAERRKRPHEERWQDMIDRGVIDKNGKVLLRGIAPRTGQFPEPDPEPEADVNGQHEPKG